MSYSKTYVVCWNEVFDNTIQIEEQLVSGGFDYLVINKSNMSAAQPKWLKARDTRYHGHFYTALEDFFRVSGSSVFIFNAGDSRWNDIAGYTARIEQLFRSNSDLGVLSPDQTNDPFTGEGSLVELSSINPGLSLATLTNGIYVALSREIAEIMYLYMSWGLKNGIDFYKMTSGWGLDYAYCAAAVYLNKYVYKDNTVLMYHPTGSGYNYDIAAKEAYEVMDSFKAFWDHSARDSTKIAKIFDMFMTKVHRKAGYKLTAKELFLNATRPLEF